MKGKKGEVCAHDTLIITSLGIICATRPTCRAFWANGNEHATQPETGRMRVSKARTEAPGFAWREDA